MTATIFKEFVLQFEGGLPCRECDREGKHHEAVRNLMDLAKLVQAQMAFEERACLKAVRVKMVIERDEDKEPRSITEQGREMLAAAIEKDKASQTA